MKKFLIFLLLIGLLITPISAFAQNSDSVDIRAKSAILVDSNSGEMLYGKDENKQLPIASVTKVMTLNLIFDAVESGNLDLDERITVSPNAAGMGGSQAFIDAGYEYTCSDLIKSIIIASANDAAVAMAERIAGSEETFVQKMNKKASDLGMSNTTFKNCTGLPKEGHLSTAADVAKMSVELLKHEDYFRWSTTWMDSLHHDKDGRNTELVNTNKLIRSLNGCDGLKTGSTSEAGFCVTTTAKRGDFRLVSVILGGNTSKERFEDAAKLINYGFANYKNKMVIAPGETVCQVPVQNGTLDSVSGIAQNGYSLCIKNDEEENVEIKTELIENISAPVNIGDTVGKVIVVKNGSILDEIPLISGDDCSKLGFFDRIKRILSLKNSNR